MPFVNWLLISQNMKQRNFWDYMTGKLKIPCLANHVNLH